MPETKYAELPRSIPCPWYDARLDLRLIFPKVWTQPAGRSFGIYWSDRLQYGTLHPSPSHEELAAFYNFPGYSDYLSGREKAKRLPKSLFDRLIIKAAYCVDRGIFNPESTISELCHQKNSTVCDIGCGSGAFLDQMRSSGATVVGIDPSDVSGRAIEERGIEFYAGTGEDLPQEIVRRKFDIVTMFQSLEHCRDPRRTLCNAKGILRPDGLLVVDVPNIACLGFRLYRQAWYHTDAGRHLHFFTLDSLKELCRSVGLKLAKVEYCGFTTQFTPEWIASMTEVWDKLFGNVAYDFAPPRPSKSKSALYLFPALLSPKRLKYDVVRIYAHPT